MSYKILDPAGKVVFEISSEEKILGPRHNIGIGITTRNRNEVFAKTYAEIERLSPGIKIVVVDDASDIVVQGPDTYRFETNVGIARAKNKCLELLYDAGVEHFFLFDDDAYPLVEDWWKPYVESPEPHLMRIFEDLSGRQKLRDIQKIYEGDGHVAYTGPRGMMLYAHRTVLDRVGGMDVAFGKWGYEHGDWSNRIHNAGLTTWRFADVINGGELIYSLDEHQAVDRLTPPVERQALVKENVKLYHAQWDCDEYRSFRPPHDVVLTALFTGGRDPQRPDAPPLNNDAVTSLLDSLRGREVHVFTDSLGELLPHQDEGHHWERVGFGSDNVYFQRWITYWRWLRDHPEVRYVWCVDGTDVVALREIFDLKPGVLYVGSEPATLSNPWLSRHHPAKIVQETIAKFPTGLLYNAGLVGGDRTVVMDFIFEIVSLWETNKIDVFHNKDQILGIGDMGALNAVLYSDDFELPVITGATVHSVFKAYQDEGSAPEARWAHK